MILNNLYAPIFVQEIFGRSCFFSESCISCRELWKVMATRDICDTLCKFWILNHPSLRLMLDLFHCLSHLIGFVCIRHVGWLCFRFQYSFQQRIRNWITKIQFSSASTQLAVLSADHSPLLLKQKTDIHLMHKMAC